MSEPRPNPMAVCPRCRAEYPAEQDVCPDDGATLCEPEDLARIGTSFASYELTEIIGVGGMGVVYKGVHTALKKTFAIKVLNEYYGKRASAYQEMLREAQAASRIRHPHIVDVTDFGTTEEGAAYLVMEYLEGTPLSAVLQQEARLPVPKAAAIIRQVADALDAAHHEGIIHRDLKPENVFLVRQPRTAVRRSQEVPLGERTPLSVKLLDFGLAKVQDMAPSTRTRAGMIAGTPYYMSPEQVRNQPVDPRSDIYALGVLFYHMVTGVLPFTGASNIEIMMAHVSQPVIPPRKRFAKIDQVTNDVIVHCMAKEPQERYQDVASLYQDLVRCGGGEVSPLSSGEVPVPNLSHALRVDHDKLTVSAELADKVLRGSARQVSVAEPQAVGTRTLPLQQPPAMAGPTVTSELVGKVLEGAPSTLRDATPSVGAGEARDEASGEIDQPSAAALSGAREPDAEAAVLVALSEPKELVEDEEDPTDPVLHRLPVASSPSPRTKILWSAVVAVSLVAGGALYWATARQADDPGPARQAANKVSQPPAPAAIPPAAAKPAALPYVRLQVEGLPAGAHVWLDGKEVHPPLQLVRSATVSHLLRVTAEGFVPEQRRLAPTADLHLVLRLRPVAASELVAAPRAKRARPKQKRGARAKAKANARQTAIAVTKPAPAGPPAKTPAPKAVAVKPEPKVSPKTPAPAAAVKRPVRPPAAAKKRYDDWVVDPFAAGKQK